MEPKQQKKKHRDLLALGALVAGHVVEVDRRAAALALRAVLHALAQAIEVLRQEATDGPVAQAAGLGLLEERTVSGAVCKGVEVSVVCRASRLLSALLLKSNYRPI